MQAILDTKCFMMIEYSNELENENNYCKFLAIIQSFCGIFLETFETKKNNNEKIKI